MVKKSRVQGFQDERRKALMALANLLNVHHCPWVLELVQKGGTISLGSENMKKFTNASKNCKCNCICGAKDQLEHKTWDENVAIDQILISKEDDPFRLDFGKEADFSDVVLNNNTIDKLPYPADVLTMKEAINWLTKQIHVNRVERGFKDGKPIYGEDSWEPDFWDNSFPWENMTEIGNLTKLTKANFTGPSGLEPNRSVVNFLREMVKKRCQMKQLDPNLGHVNPNFDRAEVLRRQSRLKSVSRAPQVPAPKAPITLGPRAAAGPGAAAVSEEDAEDVAEEGGQNKKTKSTSDYKPAARNDDSIFDDSLQNSSADSNSGSSRAPSLNSSTLVIPNLKRQLSINETSSIKAKKTKNIAICHICNKDTIEDDITFCDCSEKNSNVIVHWDCLDMRGCKRCSE
jgi:hypothetical protein